MSCKLIKTCRCCGSNKLTKVLDLNEQPLANTYHDGSKQLQNYPLVLMTCENCFHSQLNAVVDPNEMFLNYLYVSGTSKTLHDYFEWFADMVRSETVSKGSVLDIACNDGTQLQKFRTLGWKTYGIDPAKNLQHLSEKNADKIVVDYLTDNSVKLLGVESFDAIIAQNVFAHTDDVVAFLNSCKLVMLDSTKLYIQTSQADMIENNQFDTIYHEHLSFFSTKSMIALCERTGLNLISVKRTPIHGGSYIFVISKQEKPDYSVKFSLDLEEKTGRYSLNRYKEYEKEVNFIIKKFKDVVDEYKTKGYLVVGYGAAAKGNTFLNASNIKLHYILDDNTLKHNLLTPGSNTLIVSKDFIKYFANNTVFIPLAWNFYDEISKTIKLEINKLKFKKLYKYDIISFFPKLDIEQI